MNKQEIEEILKKIFAFNSDCIVSIMTPVSKLTALNLKDDSNTLLQKILKSKRTFYPVYNEDPENIVGIIHVKDLLICALKDNKIDLADGIHEPFYFKENTVIRQAYGIFNKSNTGAAFVVDEKNNITGFITLKDITKIFLQLLQFNEDPVNQLFTRKSGDSWLVDGIMPFCSFIKIFNIAVNGKEKQNAKTVGEFVVSYLGKLPNLNESFEFAGYYIEVVNVDEGRVNKILLKTN